MYYTNYEFPELLRLLAEFNEFLLVCLIVSQHFIWCKCLIIHKI